MLVLSRKLHEKIIIGGGIVIEVVDIRGDKVRLGITAPFETTVHREEVQRALDSGVPPRKALKHRTGPTDTKQLPRI